MFQGQFEIIGLETDTRKKTVNGTLQTIWISKPSKSVNTDTNRHLYALENGLRKMTNERENVKQQKI